ncbi:MAG: YjbQ family protein [Candidatus Sericytochromatia bacterium]|nr:YjbQ family protein [Candidatus Sericytochromatia bacterium]
MVITGQVERLVRASGIKTGIVVCSAMGVGAAVICLEGDDTRLGIWTDRLVGVIKETDPEIAAQLLSQLYGQSITLTIDRATLQHDPWQQLVVVDFGTLPRRRLIAIQILGD